MAKKKAPATPDIQIVEDRTVELVTRNDKDEVVERTQYAEGDEEELQKALEGRPEDLKHFLNTGAIELAGEEADAAPPAKDPKADAKKEGGK
jgi:predicted translin family RNA/ssDNA-binding protein